MYKDNLNAISPHLFEAIALPFLLFMSIHMLDSSLHGFTSLPDAINGIFFKFGHVAQTVQHSTEI